MKIHEQVTVAKRALTAVETEAQDMLEYTTGPKFQGIGGDYINIREVNEFIRRIQRAANFELAAENRS